MPMECKQVNPWQSRVELGFFGQELLEEQKQHRWTLSTGWMCQSSLNNIVSSLEQLQEPA